MDFSLQVLPTTWKHIWTVRGCIRRDYFADREVHQIWQDASDSVLCSGMLRFQQARWAE